MADIVLATINAKWIHPSLALRLLKANLGSLEERCKILEFALRQNLNEKIVPILAERPRLIGFSVSIWNHLATLELLKALDEIWASDAIKKEKSETGQKPLVVLGGPEVSWLSQDAEIFRYADYVIRGEGEESFRALCCMIFSEDRRLPEPVNKKGRPEFINSGNVTVNVEAIKTAYHLYTDEDLNKKLVYVEASRGCVFGCDFCQAAACSGAVREFPLEPLFASLETMIEKRVRTFKFLDRTFNLNARRAAKIMEFFLDRIASSDFCVHFEMVPSGFTPDLRELIRRFPPGTLRLELGIQTFNPRTASLIRRPGKISGTKFSAVQDCFGEEAEILEFLCGETNAIVHADLIAGLPGEDLASFGAGLDRLWQIMSGASQLISERSFEIQIGILKCLPGASVTRHNEAYGMRYAALPPYEVIETGALHSGELDKIKNFARFWELIVNRNPFPDVSGRILPRGKPVFDGFLELSGKLYAIFGRNWGIDRKELRTSVENVAGF